MLEYKEIKFVPAYDKRHENPRKNYGIHGAEIRFTVGENKGQFVHFSLYTNWFLPETQKWLDARVLARGVTQFSLAANYHPDTNGLGYHSPYPVYEGQEPAQLECEFLDGEPCYSAQHDSGLQGYLDALIAGGLDALWGKLEAYYRRVFADAERRAKDA